ncbi:hypothetical protein [Phocaeicola sartorii]|uniref:hypothetical protein n=1 Tax=Phocaeicola sartorii TaxID=671267 RepID=UPI0035158B7C
MNSEENTSIIKQRLLEICDDLEISARAFSTKIGMSATYLTSLNKDVTSSVLNNILSAYPDIDIMWIITGKGEKFKSDHKKPSDSDNLTIFMKEEIRDLKEENKALYKEIGKLEGVIQELKKRVVLTENDVGCAAASGSDLVR